MPRDYSTFTSANALPVIDTPERQRFSFWWPHATPIQASLLQVTGWLSEDPDRTVPVEGKTEPVPVSDVRPSESVLFRLEKPGTRERADWEWYFLTVRRVQAHGRLVRQKVAETKARQAQLDQRIATLRTENDRRAEEAEKEHAEFVQKVKRLEVAAREAAAGRSETPRRMVRTVVVPSGALGSPDTPPAVFEYEDESEPVPDPKPRPNEPYRQLLVARDEGRAIADKWAQVQQDLARRLENLTQERAPIEQRLRWLEERSHHRVFPGLFATVNAFLDIQALSAASVAIEEFRKTPRRESALADELEARLAVD